MGIHHTEQYAVIIVRNVSRQFINEGIVAHFESFKHGVQWQLTKTRFRELRCLILTLDLCPALFRGQ
ncbi:hypothetical protein EC3234A_141c00030 [Escherichia coli]|nr:hypothetical protein EC3234A_141c00030 [Escherichia coli]